jgi:hypothetical protein
MTFSKLQNLSPPRPYIQLSSNFHRSSNHTMSILKSWLFDPGLTDSRTPKNRRFLTILDFKAISSEDTFAKWLKFSQSILQSLTNILRWAFMQFPAEVRNMNFSRSREKKIRKKMCFDFFESRLKWKPRKHWLESWLT